MNRTLAIILASGAVFRFLYLGKRQLWTDELMQALVVRASTPLEMLARLKEGMAVPAPLDYFVQKGFIIVLGDAAWAHRVHAALFGSVAIWFFYRIALRLFGERVALYCTLLFALYPLHYHYSQVGRPYALFVLLTLVSYDLLLRNLSKDRAGWKEWGAFGLIGVLLLYSSMLGLLVLLSQTVYIMLSSLRAQTGGPSDGPVCNDLARVSRRQLVRLLSAALIAVALFAPWLKFAWSPPNVAPASEIANPKILLRTIKELGDNSYPMAFLLFLGVATGIRALRHHGCSRTVIFLLSWALVSLPVVLILEIASGYFFAVRHLLHATPPLLLLAGYGLSYVGERLTILDRLPYRVSAPAIAYAALGMVISVWIAQSHWRSEPVDWSGAARFLAENAREGDRMTIPETYILLQYYAPSLAEFRVDDLEPGPGSLHQEEVRRRFVVCFNGLSPDPCAGFRAAATRDSAWRRREIRGFTVFVREK